MSGMSALSLFDFAEYKAFVRARNESTPNHGRGELAKISRAIGVHKTTLSQIFKGSKDLSLEQAHKLARYFELSIGETSYFLLLVDTGRAGSEDLRQHFAGQIQERQKEHRKLANRVARSRAIE